MVGLHFDITADNTSFMQRVNEIKTGVQNASGVINNLSKNFDVSTVENKIIALNKVIRDNESVILQSTKQIQKWSLDAQEAFNNNDLSTFNTITKDIEEQASKIAELRDETMQYYDALSMVESSGGVQASSIQNTDAPKFFKSQEDYEYAESLREKIEELQSQIAEFDGSDEDLQKLRSTLSQTQEKLRGCELEAAQAASELGANLGSRASEASEMLYTLNGAVEKQELVVKTLSIAVQEAAQSLATLQESEDPTAIDDAQVKYDALSVSLQNAQLELANLQAAQSDASASFAQVNQEVELHDSLMVKMLGGYENYQTVIGQLPGPIQGVIGSINGMTGAAKAFIATPLGAIIVAIVLALQALKTWFDSSVEGQKAFAEISGYVSGVLDQLKEIVITVGKAIYNAFSNPKKAVEDLWKAIKTNIVNRFKSVGEMAKSLGALMKAALTFDSDAIQKEFHNLTNSMLKFGTGIDNVTGKVSKLVKGVNDAAKANAKFAKEEKEIEIAASEEQKKSAQRQLEMTKLRTKMYDSKASKEDKKAAREEYKRLNKEDVQAQLNIKDREIALQEGRMALTTNRIEDENALRELQAQRIQIENQGAQREMMLQRMSNRLDKTPKQTGKTGAQISSDQQKAHQNILALMKQQYEDRLKLQQEYEYQEWQNRIDLMQEGEAKVLAQMQLDNKKELSALEEQKQQAINAEIARQKALFDAREDEKATEIKGYAKQIFDPKPIYDPENNVVSENIKEIIGRYDNLQSQLLAKQKKAESDRLDAAKESMNSYLKEFGSYQQKRLAIEEEYEKKISEAQNEGERMMLIGQRNRSESDLDYEEWVNTGEIALAFGDIDKLSKQTVARLISDMEKYREKVIATFDPDKIQKYEDALANLRSVNIDNTFGAFAGYVPDWFKQRKSVGSQMDSAGENINGLYKERGEILNRILNLKEMIADAEESGEDVKKLTGELEEAEAAYNANSNAVTKAMNAFRQLQEQWDQLNTPEQKFYALCGAISSVTSVVGPLASQAAEMCDAMGAEGLGKALSALSEAMDAVGNIANGFSQGGLVGGIAAGVGEIMKWTTKLFQAGDNRKQKNIERIQEQIDALNKSYEKLGRLADDAFSTDASNLISQQDTLLRQQQALIRQQMAEEEAKKKTDSDKIKQYKEQLEEINETLEDNKKKAKEAIIGEDLKSAINEFASLYAEAWNDGTDAAQKSMAAVKNIISSALSEMLKKDIQPAATKFYDKLAEYMSDGTLEDWELGNLDAIKREMDALAAKSQEQWEMIQSRYKDLDELKEELTDISFDSVRDNFKSLLSDMESTTADFTDSFSDMLRNALINGLMDTKYDNMLKEWYDEFAEAMNDRSLTDSERDTLRQKYDAIVQQGLEDRDFINSIVGGGAYSQEASKGWSTTLTQDQGDELNGRFTALTELEAINNSLVSEGNMIAIQILDTLRSLSSLTMVADGENPTLREIRDMMFLSTGHLEDISKYTKQLITIREGIDKLNDLINQRL